MLFIIYMTDLFISWTIFYMIMIYLVIAELKCKDVIYYHAIIEWNMNPKINQKKRKKDAIFEIMQLY